MKTFYPKVFIGLLFVLSVLNGSAQLASTPYSVDMTVHNGVVGGVDLTGYVTYELYVNFANADNYLISVFANEDPVTDCVFDPVSEVYFNFPCGLFQFQGESHFGNLNNCLYTFGFPGQEAGEFDSYMTLGHECSSQVVADAPVNIGFCPEWITAFEGPANADMFDGGSFFWDGYAVSVASVFNPATSVSYAGADQRVKIAQFTSCGGWDGCFNITYKTAAQVNTTAFSTEYNICLEVPHPCIDFPMDTEASVTQPLCFGDDATVVLEDGGYGSVDYTLWSGGTIGSGTQINTFANQGNGYSTSTLDPGSYYFTMVDSVGCLDTTAVFTIVEPEELVFQPELLQEVLCFGDLNGQIALECSGGTAPVTITSNSNGAFSCGDQLTDLACGIYTLVATDDNGCSVTEVIDITCPEELVIDLSSTDIPCYNYDNGTITGIATGGTGVITATLFQGTTELSNQTATGLLNVNFTNLDGGDYSVEIVDENGCGESFDFTIVEPDPVVVTPTVTDVNCFEVCNGTVTFDIQGGVGPFTTVVNDANGSAANPNALCDGIHSYIITDFNGCNLTGEVEVLQPLQITYTLETTAASCFAICDGQIDITDVSGGIGDFTYSIAPNAGLCGGTCSGTSANYSNLCAGTYAVTITDEAGCPRPITNIVIVGPAELQIQLNPTNVTCFGEGNGQVVITSIGGTGDVMLTPGNQELPVTITDLVPGTYTYTIQDANGCLDEDDVIITEPELLVVTEIEANDVSCGGACDGTLLYEVVGGTEAYSYTLLPNNISGGVNGTVGNLCAEDFQLIIEDAQGCLDTLDFTIAEPPALVIDFNLNAPTCTGMNDGTAQVIVSGGTGILTTFISPEDVFTVVAVNDTTFNLDLIPEGTIEITLIDESNCILEEEYEVIPDIITDMVLSTFSSPETCWNTQDGTATVGVQNGNLPISYLWDDPSEQTTPTAIGLTSSEFYTVTVTDDIGCTLDATVFVDPTIGCFYIATAITPNGDGSNDEWVIGGLEFFPDATVQVFNRWGQEVFESKGYPVRWDGRFKGEFLPVADYYFIIEYDKSKDPILGTVTIKY